MSYFKIVSNNHLTATSHYQKAAKEIGKINHLDRVEDSISIQGDKKFDVGGVNTLLGEVDKGKNVLFSGDKILLNEKKQKRSFFNLIKEKFDSIAKSEETSRSAIASDTNMLELAATIKEAEIALEQGVAVRDKLVTLWKDLLNTAF